MKRPINAVIEDVIVESSKIQPIIVNFQNGELKDEEAKKMSCGVFFDPQKQKRVLALSNGQVVYKGYKPDTKNDLTCTMLVLHNKKTGKVRLVQAERWPVNPVLQKPQIEHNNSLTKDSNLLNKQFGSKKVKRRIEQNERLQMNIDSVKEQLEKSVSNVEIDRLDLSAQTEDKEFLNSTSLSYCNRDATTVEEVYNIYDIVPKDKLETLYDRAMEVLKGEFEEKSLFFISTVKSLKSDPDKVRKAALLIYIQGVCTWLSMPIKGAKKQGIQACSASEEANSYIIDTYSVSSAHGRLRPNSMKDKGVIDTMILALIICNFTLDLEKFATILNNRSMGFKKLTHLARIIGAVPNKDDKKVVSLKLPLPTQLSIVRKGKKK